MQFVYILLIIIVVYYLVSRLFENYSTQEDFDPSLVPVSSIVTLAKVAQKLVDGGGTLTNPGNLTVTGNLSTNGNLTVTGNLTAGGQIQSQSISGPFLKQSGVASKDQLFFWNNGDGQLLIIGSTGTDYTWGQEVGINGKTSTISCNNIVSGAAGGGSTGNINIKSNLLIGTSDPQNIKPSYTGIKLFSNLGTAAERRNDNTTVTFAHTNNTQGIGIGYDGLYKIGTLANTTGKDINIATGGPNTGNVNIYGSATISGNLSTNTINAGTINAGGPITGTNLTSLKNVVNGITCQYTTYLSDSAGTGTPTYLEVHYYENGTWKGRPYSYSPAGDFRCSGNLNCSSLTIGGTTITENHLKMLTGAIPIQLSAQTSNGDTSNKLQAYKRNDHGCQNGVNLASSVNNKLGSDGCNSGNTTYFTIST